MSSPISLGHLLLLSLSFTVLFAVEIFLTQYEQLTIVVVASFTLQYFAHRHTNRQAIEQ